ncbi:MAG: hypothetical protein KF858_04205 [Candidatus Sumerlaeia bacterium]|nr:hypothetical protein [Candidatus Sumerlaeia bacterium]
MRTPLPVVLLLLLATSLVAQAPPPSVGSPGFVTRREEARETFLRDYGTEVRAYPVGRTMNRGTARQLVERLITRYYLLQDYTDKYGRSHDVGIVSESDLGRTPTDPAIILESISEQVLEDAASDALIVDALPATHDRIEAMFAALNKTLTTTREASTPQHVRVEVILLRGTSAEPHRGITVLDGQFNAMFGYDPGAGIPSMGMPEMGMGRPAAKVETPLPNPAAGFRYRRFVKPDEAAPLASEQYRLIHLAVTEESRIEAYHVAEGEVVEANSPMITVTTRNGSQTFQQNAPARLVVHKLATVQAGSSVPSGTSLISFQLLGDLDSRRVPQEPSRADWAKRLGIDETELAILGDGAIMEVGRSIINLRPESGDLGTARLSLGTQDGVLYTCELAYRGQRQAHSDSSFPLVTRLRTQPANSSAPAEGRTLIDNFVYLEPGKPALLGITNLREAIVLVFRRIGG